MTLTTIVQRLAVIFFLKGLSCFQKNRGNNIEVEFEKKNSNKFGPSAHLIVDISWSLT